MEIRIKEINEHERPREKALKYGISSLSNRDLLALLLRCGCKGMSALQLADILLAHSQGLAYLSTMRIEELKTIHGISDAKALEIAACFELSKRASYQVLHDAIDISSPRVIVDYLYQKIGNKDQEHFVVLYLNTKNRLIKEETVFIGSLNSSIVHSREIFKGAICYSSAKIIIAHNHPSNVCIPSEQDIEVTQRIAQTGDMIGIPLLDHIIIGKNNYFSFKEHQLLK